MNYIICKADNAREAGISLTGKLVDGEGNVLLNESSLTSCENLEGVMDDRVKALDGRLLSDSEAREYIAEKGMTVENAIVQ